MYIIPVQSLNNTVYILFESQFKQTEYPFNVRDKQTHRQMDKVERLLDVVSPLVMQVKKNSGKD